MAAPNLIAGNVITGNTVGVSLTNTSATSILSNPSSSGHCYKVNTLNVSNGTGSAANITVAWYNAASIGGTAFPIANTMSVPAYSTINIIDKTSQYYLAENTSIGATAGTSNALTITLSYEDIS